MENARVCECMPESLSNKHLREMATASVKKIVSRLAFPSYKYTNTILNENNNKYFI